MCQCMLLALNVAKFNDQQVRIVRWELVWDGRADVGGRRVLTDGRGLNRDLPTYVVK